MEYMNIKWGLILAVAFIMKVNLIYLYDILDWRSFPF